LFGLIEVLEFLNDEILHMVNVKMSKKREYYDSLRIFVDQEFEVFPFQFICEVIDISNPLVTVHAKSSARPPTPKMVSAPGQYKAP
jgi:hypothetical protein